MFKALDHNRRWPKDDNAPNEPDPKAILASSHDSLWPDTYTANMWGGNDKNPRDIALPANRCQVKGFFDIAG